LSSIAPRPRSRRPKSPPRSLSNSWLRSPVGDQHGQFQRLRGAPLQPQRASDAGGHRQQAGCQHQHARRRHVGCQCRGLVRGDDGFQPGRIGQFSELQRAGGHAAQAQSENRGEADADTRADLQIVECHCVSCVERFLLRIAVLPMPG
jgi:hypothetical protein